MKYSNVLPENFDGTFRFTNDSDEDFVAKWGGKEYVFPAHTTSPMFIPDETQLGIQQIRKKFAKDWAEREYFRGKDYERLLKQEKNPDGSPRLNSLHQAGTYSMNELAPYIQRCLIPLPASRAMVREAQKDNLVEKLHRDDDGEIVTQAVEKGADLRKRPKLT